MMEPHDITTVLRRPPVGMEKPRTLQDYQADLVRRFGKVPSWRELAKRENAATRAKLSPMARERQETSQDLLTARQIAYKAIQAARTQETRQSILEALTRPSTASDVSRRIKRDEHLIRRQLAIMADLGLISKQKIKNVTIWNRAAMAEAAE